MNLNQTVRTLAQGPFIREDSALRGPSQDKTALKGVNSNRSDGVLHERLSVRMVTNSTRAAVAAARIVPEISRKPSHSVMTMQISV